MRQYGYSFGKIDIKRAVVCIVIGALLLPGAVRGQDEPTLSFELFTDQFHPDRNFVLGEAIPLIMVLKNIWGYDIITRQGFAQKEIHRSLLVTDPKGKKHVLDPDVLALTPRAQLQVKNRGTAPAEILPANWIRSVTISDLRAHFPVMGTVPGLYRIQAHLQFTHYAEGIPTVLGYLAFTDKRIGAEEPVLHSNLVELQVLPPAGGNIEVEVVLQDQAGQTLLSGISTRLFAAADISQNNWSLADAWQLGTPILSGVTGTEGTAIWNEGLCLNAGDYTAVAAYHDAYQSAVYQTNDGDWGPGCEQTVRRQIVFETALAPIEDLYARAKSGKINIVWSCPVDALNYDVYRSTTQGGPYQLIQEGHETMYCAFADFGLTNNITYYYVVQWRNAGGVLSPDSNEANATPTDRIRRR